MRKLLLATSLIMVFACGSGDAPMREPTIDIEPAEIEVAEAAIGSWISRPGKGSQIVPGQVVIDRLQPYCASFRSPEEQAETLRGAAKEDPLLLEAINDFLLKRESDVSTARLVEGIDGLDLQSKANVSPPPHTYVSGRGNRVSTWEWFGKRFPRSHGYGSISRVGLSHNGQLAVIAHSWLGGFLMAVGKYSVFEKVNGRWEPSSRKIKAGWVS